MLEDQGSRAGRAGNSFFAKAGRANALRYDRIDERVRGREIGTSTENKEKLEAQDNCGLPHCGRLRLGCRSGERLLPSAQACGKTPSVMERHGNHCQI